MAVMNTTRVGPTTPAALPTNVPAIGGPNSVGTPGSGSGGMSPSTVPSPVQGMVGNMGSPHGPGMGLKSGSQQPSANVLQVVKQVNLFIFSNL